MLDCLYCIHNCLQVGTKRVTLGQGSQGRTQYINHRSSSGQLDCGRFHSLDDNVNMKYIIHFRSQRIRYSQTHIASLRLTDMTGLSCSTVHLVGVCPISQTAYGILGLMIESGKCNRSCQKSSSVFGSSSPNRCHHVHVTIQSESGLNEKNRTINSSIGGNTLRKTNAEISSSVENRLESGLAL